MPKSFTPPTSQSTGKDNLSNDAFYRVILAFSAWGQVVQNVLYYRLGLSALPGGWSLAGAQQLAEAIQSKVWDDVLKSAVSAGVTLETITVYPYNGDFDPVVNLPYVLTVNEIGTATGTTAGPASNVTCSFNIEPQTAGLNGWFPPKRGSVAFGPIRENDTGEDGRLTTTAQAFFAQKLAILASDIWDVADLAVFWPCRISTTKVAGVLTLRGFSDVSGVTIRDVAKFRRSRLPEA